MNNLDAVLQQYEKNKAENTRPQKPKMSDEDRKKRYFSPYLEKNEQTGERKIRIIPAKDGSPFVEVYYHEIQVGGKWTKIYDPGKNEGKESPLNETYAALKAAGDTKSKELAKQYNPKKFYIVKVIDRENEADGPKFWRFKSNYKGEGILDKIIPIFKKKGDIADPQTGRDLILTLNKATTNNITYYTNVSGILHDDPSPLHEDATIAEAWMNDPLSWEDVYSKKSLDYLKGVAAGYEPQWSTKLNKYVWGDNKEDGAEFSGTSTTTGNATDFLKADPEDEEEAVDDLPF